ncbi:MAG TPA: hypothetical protein PKB10_12615, partial [Tepidisphaeraceae bacterium]|nr:hypothetical protein [Tepidisphaeraceae bacterium]
RCPRPVITFFPKLLVAFSDERYDEVMKTYRAIIEGEKLTWLGDRPPADRPVAALIETDETEEESGGSDGKSIAAANRHIVAATGGVTSIVDPVCWQREQRAERSLPGRAR